MRNRWSEARKTQTREGTEKHWREGKTGGTEKQDKTHEGKFPK